MTGRREPWLIGACLAALEIRTQFEATVGTTMISSEGGSSGRSGAIRSAWAIKMRGVESLIT